jgi:hypothetical protein
MHYWGLAARAYGQAASRAARALGLRTGTGTNTAPPPDQHRQAGRTEAARLGGVGLTGMFALVGRGPGGAGAGAGEDARGGAWVVEHVMHCLLADPEPAITCVPSGWPLLSLWPTGSRCCGCGWRQRGCAGGAAALPALPARTRRGRPPAPGTAPRQARMVRYRRPELCRAMPCYGPWP